MGAPSLIDAQSDRILTLLNGLIDTANNMVQEGGAASDGGTTQASGASTAPNVDVDVSAIAAAAVAGTTLSVAAATDVDADAGDQIDWGATSGVSAVGDVLLLAAGTFVIAFGDPASTGQELPPSDAQKEAVAGTSEYALVSRLTLERTGDTAVTITFDDSVRLTLAGVLSTPLLTTEIGFAVDGRERVQPTTQDPPPA